MKPDQVRGLARATCCWLAYKHITGFQDTLGEAMLAIPISEYLTKSVIIEKQRGPQQSKEKRKTTSWILETEVLYKELDRKWHERGLPEFSCDFAGSATGGTGYRFILETKYLKSRALSAAGRISVDLIRLSLPPDDRLKRYFLLAGSSEHFEKSNGSDFLSRHKLLELKADHGHFFNPREEIENSEFQTKFSQYGVLLEKSVVRESAFIQCGANETVPFGDGQDFRVMIWSVGGNQSLAESAFAEKE